MISKVFGGLKGRVKLISKERMVADMCKKQIAVTEDFPSAAAPVVDEQAIAGDPAPAAPVVPEVKAPCKSCKPSAKLMRMQHKGKSVLKQKVNRFAVGR